MLFYLLTIFIYIKSINSTGYNLKEPQLQNLFDEIS